MSACPAPLVSLPPPHLQGAYARVYRGFLLPAAGAAGAANGAGQAAAGTGSGAAPAEGLPVAIKVIESAEVNAFLKEAGILEHLNGSPQVTCGVRAGDGPGRMSVRGPRLVAASAHGGTPPLPPTTHPTHAGGAAAGRLRDRAAAGGGDGAV